ncbi:hypothetical protein N9X46_01695 [Paracoccaceae bacterium]|nr:hypothetical protein [Paracoccaceae bacterium]
MMRCIFILALCALMVCEDKEAFEPLAITPSGWPEAIFKNKSQKSLSETRVKCDANITEENKQWARNFVGSHRSRDIHVYIQFNLIKRGADTHVQVIELMKLQMPGEQIRCKDHNTPYYNNGAQAYLYKIGGQPV